jgi:hypothetical protein
MENDTKSIRDYLKETNSKVIDDVSDKIVDPIKKISGTVVNYMNPKDFVKNFSIITKLPLLQNIGSEIKDITKSLKEQIFQGKQEKKNNFLLEAQKNKEISLKEENNDLLRKIEGKDFAGEEKKKDDKKIFGKMFGSIFGKTFGKIFSKLGATTIGGAVAAGLKKSKGLLSKIGGTKAGGIATKGLKGIGKFGKVALKGLGKVALPLALLMGAFDFTKGFKDALSITGKDDLMSKIKVGLSSVISGFLFGLIDPKTIYEFFGKLKDKIIGIFSSPLETIKKIAGVMFSGGEWLSGMLNTLTFGLFPADLIPNIMTFVKDKFVGIFVNPFVNLKNWLDENKPFSTIANYISDKLNGIVTGMSDGIYSIIEKFISFKDGIVNIFKNPLKTIKSMFSGDEIDNRTEPVVVSKKIDFRPIKETQTQAVAKQIKQNKIDEKKTQNAGMVETNNQTIVNSNTSNNIVQDDMSISTDDMDYRNLQLY